MVFCYHLRPFGFTLELQIKEIVMGKEGERYEKQRELRIAHNKARMEALGLRTKATKLKQSSGKKKQKRIIQNEKLDVDYEPESHDDDTESDGDSGHDYVSQKEIEKMDPRDDEVNEQEDNPTSQEPTSQEPTTSQSTRKTGRGPSKPVEGSEPMILAFDEFDLPSGTWEFQYGRHIGFCSKRIDINIPDWKHVTDLDKDTLWDETKKLFHIDDPNGVRKKNFLRALAARFRNHKSDLVARFINRKTAPKEGNPNAAKKPWELYQGFITEEQWKTFEAYVSSDQFKKKSEIGKSCSQGNVHRHTLGQKSYSRKRKDWVKEERLPPPSESSTAESSVVSSSVQNRALEWCLAHQRPTKDGKWEVDPTKVETVRVVQQVMEYLEKESKEKEDGGEIDNDALTKALGKKDYDGYVKGIGRSGVGVGRRKAFGKVSRKGSEPRDEEIKELKATIAELKANQSQFVAQLEAQRSEFKAYVASLSEINKEVVSIPHQEEKSTIEVPKKCRLAIMDEDGNLVVVADGTCHPSEVLHTSRLLPNHYKVSVNNPYEEHKLVELPVPSPDGETQLGNAKGYFVSWPISLVLFDDATLNYHDKKTLSLSKGEQVGSCDPLRTQESEPGIEVHERQMIVASERLDRTPQCDLLNMLMVDESHDTVRVPLKGSMLYLKEDQVVWVTSLDVNELIRGACINVSVIQVFIRYLVELQATLQGEYITFLCPHRVSGLECKRIFLDVVAYVKQALVSLLTKEHQAHLILVPYNEDNHWILMAIDLSAGVLYQLDPLAQQQPRQLSCDNVFNLAYKSYKARIKGGDSKMAFDVVHVECAQQTGGLECGYYVMKYMDELVKKASECSGDVKQIQEYITSRSSSPYSQKELDEIREEWARFFRENLLL